MNNILKGVVAATVLGLAAAGPASAQTSNSKDVPGVASQNAPGVAPPSGPGPNNMSGSKSGKAADGTAVAPARTTAPASRGASAPSDNVNSGLNTQSSCDQLTGAERQTCLQNLPTAAGRATAPKNTDGTTRR
jgi:hypothetical protein